MLQADGAEMQQNAIQIIFHADFKLKITYICLTSSFSKFQTPFYLSLVYKVIYRPKLFAHLCIYDYLEARPMIYSPVGLVDYLHHILTQLY